MKTLQKRLIIVLGILVAIMLTMTVCFYRAFYVNPNQLNTNYIHLKDAKIPKEVNDISMLYFTDLQYGKYQNDERTQKMIDQINHLDPDILIFGGDLYDESCEITDETNQKLANFLSSIDAPMGKFAVWGEKDLADESRRNAISWIYSQSQIEVLDNRNVHIGNFSKVGFRLIGLSPEANLEQALSNVNTSEYNIVITHQPDILTDPSLEAAGISYAFAGHSHGTQISYPIVGGYQKMPGAAKLNRSAYQNLSFPYLISTGVGNTKINARFWATPEIDYFLLSNK